MVKVFVVGITVIAFSIAYSMRAAPPDDDAKVALFERYLESLRRSTHVPGVSGLILRDGRAVWMKGLGYQDLESRVVANADTLYDIASLTKTFTSTLLLQCVERRTLSLDEPMSRYTTAIPEASATVRHVLTHTSLGSPGAVYRYDGSRFSALTAVVSACQGKPFRLAVADILDRSAMFSVSTASVGAWVWFGPRMGIRGSLRSLRRVESDSLETWQPSIGFSLRF